MCPKAKQQPTGTVSFVGVQSLMSMPMVQAQLLPPAQAPCAGVGHALPALTMGSSVLRAPPPWYICSTPRACICLQGESTEASCWASGDKTKTNICCGTVIIHLSPTPSMHKTTGKWMRPPPGGQQGPPLPLSLVSPIL